MAQENLYSILEVSRDATQTEIKKSYLRQCKKYHPDLNGGKTNEEIIKKINNAYDILGDEAKRRNYDAELILEEMAHEHHTTYTKDDDEYEDEYDTDDEEYDDINPDDISEEMHYNPETTQKDESVFDILDNMDEYGFFGAIKIIYKRNIFELFGVTLVSLLIVTGIIIKRIFGIFTITILTETDYDTAWGRWLAQQIAGNRLWRQFWRFVLLLTVFLVNATALAIKAIILLSLVTLALLTLLGSKKRKQ